jgi:hypothetical protein
MPDRSTCTRAFRPEEIHPCAYPLREHAKPYEFGESISGWKVVWRSLWPRSSKQVVPSIVETLYGATSINARYQIRAMAELADANVTYPVEDFDPLDFTPYAPLVQIGHQEARRALEAWRAQRARPAPPKRPPAS